MFKGVIKNKFIILYFLYGENNSEIMQITLKTKESTRDLMRKLHETSGKLICLTEFAPIGCQYCPLVFKFNL